MKKYILITSSELDNYLQSLGFIPTHSNSDKSIYEKNEKISLAINGWHWSTNNHGRYKGHYDINSERELELELKYWG